VSLTPLVLVHGFMGGAAQWQGQREALGVSREIITPDLPGFGENNAATAPTRIADYAAYVLDHLSAQGVDRFDLLGHSMGGMIVQEMVAMAPERVARLVLYGTGAFSHVEGRFETYEESKRRAQADGARATARRIAATWFRQGEQAPGYEACAAIAEQASLQAIHAGIDAFGNWSREANLPNIAAPTLIIWGEHDKSYAWSQIEQLWRTIPGASLAVVPGCAHAVHLEKPELFNLLLADFLEGR
jgi:2-hydroxy-6-oxonona-2,4-dienedioate hydrolase